MKLELEMLRRHVELEDLHRVRLDARTAGRTGRPMCWVASPEEEDDDETLEAFRAFRPRAWWEDI